MLLISFLFRRSLRLRFGSGLTWVDAVSSAGMWAFSSQASFFFMIT